jgi:hypothetical protein
VGLLGYMGHAMQMTNKHSKDAPHQRSPRKHKLKRDPPYACQNGRNQNYYKHEILVRMWTTKNSLKVQMQSRADTLKESGFEPALVVSYKCELTFTIMTQKLYSLIRYLPKVVKYLSA